MRLRVGRDWRLRLRLDRALWVVTWLSAAGLACSPPREPQVTAKGPATPSAVAPQSVPAPQPNFVTPPAKPSPPAASPSPELFWEGDSAGFHVRWTSADVSASSAGAEFSLSKRFAQQAARELAAMRADDQQVEQRRAVSGGVTPAKNDCTWSSRVRVLSLVGPLLGVREQRSAECEAEAHPSEETRFSLIDLAHPDRAVTLDAIFPEAAIAAALRADKLVRRALPAGVPHAGPLADLVRALAASEPVLDTNLCYKFPRDLLARFAFHHVDAGRVAVRLGVPGAGPCRANSTEIGMFLPIPESLRDALASAQAHREGVLMADAERVAKGRDTTFVFDPRATQ